MLGHVVFRHAAAAAVVVPPAASPGSSPLLAASVLGRPPLGSVGVAYIHAALPVGALAASGAAAAAAEHKEN